MPATAVARLPGGRELTDPQTMRALAHPVRVALLEALRREGPLTASQAAALLDDSPGNMSWHFQTLAKYGFVEEAGTGRGRSRPWRLVSLGTQFSTRPEGGEISTAAEILEATYRERTFEALRQWMVERPSFTSEWQAAAFASESISYLRADEMLELHEELRAILDRYKERTYDRSKRPADARPVHLFLTGHPLRPSPSGN